MFRRSPSTLSSSGQHKNLASTRAIVLDRNEDPLDITDVIQWGKLDTSLTEVRPFMAKQYIKHASISFRQSQKTDRMHVRSEADRDVMQKVKAALCGDIQYSTTIPDNSSWISYHQVGHQHGRDCPTQMP
jgi:hypothetical protein